MSRHSNGWFKVWRWANDHWLNKDHEACFLWMKLLMMATYRPTKIKHGAGFINLDPGTVVTSRAELHAMTGFGEKVIRNKLKLFEMGQMVGQQRASYGTVITICNWKKYQEYENSEGQQRASSGASDGPAEGQRWASDGPHSKKLRIKESNSLTGDLTSPEPKKPSKKDPTEGSLAWASYEEAFFTRYGFKPARNAKTASIFANLVKTFGKDAAVKLSAYYLQDEREFFVRAKHSVGILATKAEEIFNTMRSKEVGESPFAAMRRIKDEFERDLKDGLIPVDMAEIVWKRRCENAKIDVGRTGSSDGSPGVQPERIQGSA